MPVTIEQRKSERFGHEYIIKFEDDLTLSPIYAVSYNLSETGMYFKSLIELYPGTHIRLITDDYLLGRKIVPAMVAWCKRLENTTTFRYGIGVEFLPLEKNAGLKAFLPIVQQMKAPIRMERRV